MSDEDLPKLINENESDSDSSDEENWIETNEDELPEVKNLFNDKSYASFDFAIQDMKDQGFDLSKLKKEHDMDDFSFIKLINFIAFKAVKDPNDLFSNDGSPLWLSDEFLKPSGNDFYNAWLQFDFDQLTIDGPELNETELLKRTIAELKEQISVKDQMMEKMKEAFTHLISKEPSTAIPSTKTQDTKKRITNGVASVPIDDDSGYFEGYSHFAIHHSMLSDKVRTESYRDAILRNSAVIKNKLVMDLGCGTAILSMFASQAGAQTVYAVDQSEIIYQAMEIIETNKFKNIKFVKGRLEDVDFPTEKVDVIISEWMGYLLFFEGMLDSVIYARNNYLREGGLLFPNKCNVSLVGYGSEERYNNFINFFHDVYGFNMKCMLKDILREGHVERCEDKFVLTKPNIVCDLDLMTCDLNYSNFSYEFNLEVTKDAKLNSFVGYFDIFFDLPDTVSFSTSPASEPTHWQQAVFYLDEPVDVKTGEVVSGTFICQRDRKDLRSLIVEIRVFNKIFKYALN